MGNMLIKKSVVYSVVTDLYCVYESNQYAAKCNDNVDHGDNYVWNF